MRILVVGARGMLGTDFVRAASYWNHEVVGFDLPELDITDGKAVWRACVKHQPEVVVNLAAYTDVDGAEDNREAAVRVNVEGAKFVALAAAEVGASVVY